MATERFGTLFEENFTSCPKCSEAGLVEVFFGKPNKDNTMNAIAHCHFCGHQQIGEARWVKDPHAVVQKIMES
jgi:transcription elongation factor Elf1